MPSTPPECQSVTLVTLNASLIPSYLHQVHHMRAATLIKRGTSPHCVVTHHHGIHPSEREKGHEPHKIVQCRARRSMNPEQGFTYRRWWVRVYWHAGQPLPSSPPCQSHARSDNGSSALTNVWVRPMASFFPHTQINKPPAQG